MRLAASSPAMMFCWTSAGVGRRRAGACLADAGAVVVALTVAAGAVTDAALTGFVVRLVCSCITGAEKSVPVTTLRAGLGLLTALDEGRADRAVVELLAEEPLVEPESSGAAAATAALAPEAISKPAPIANPNVVIRPARSMEVTSAPAHRTAIDICLRWRRRVGAAALQPCV